MPFPSSTGRLRKKSCRCCKSRKASRTQSAWWPQTDRKSLGSVYGIRKTPKLTTSQPIPKCRRSCREESKGHRRFRLTKCPCLLFTRRLLSTPKRARGFFRFQRGANSRNEEQRTSDRCSTVMSSAPAPVYQKHCEAA